MNTDHTGDIRSLQTGNAMNLSCQCARGSQAPAAAILTCTAGGQLLPAHCAEHLGVLGAARCCVRAQPSTGPSAGSSVRVLLWHRPSSTANSGFDPNSLTDSTIFGMDMGLAAGLACVARTAQSRQQATQTSTRWQPLSGTASYGHDCKRHNSYCP